MTIEKFKKDFKKEPEQIIFYGISIIVSLLIIAIVISAATLTPKKYTIMYDCDWNGCRVLGSDRADIVDGCLQTDDRLICADYVIKERK